MGLFSPPSENIRKRLPVSAANGFDVVASFVSAGIGGVDKQQKEFAIAFVTSVWACQNAVAGLIPLSQFDHRYIMNSGANCARMLRPENMKLADALITQLQQQRLIPSVSSLHGDGPSD